MEGVSPSKLKNTNMVTPTPINTMGQTEVQETQHNDPTRQWQNYDAPTTQTIIPQTPSDLAGILSEAAKANAEFWANQCMVPQHASQAISPSVARMTSSTFTTDLPLLPTPKALQTAKRGREEGLMGGRATAGQCVMVKNLPHAATRGDIQNLFGQYEWKSIRMPSPPAGYAVVRLASMEEAGRAVRDLSGKMIRDSKILVQLEEHKTPELPFTPDEGVLAKRVKTEERSEIREVIRAPVDATRAEIDAAIEAEKKDMTAVKKTKPTTQKVERESRCFLRIGDLPFKANEKDFGEFLAGIDVYVANPLHSLSLLPRTFFSDLSAVIWLIHMIAKPSPSPRSQTHTARPATQSSNCPPLASRKAHVRHWPDGNFKAVTSRLPW